MGVYGFLEGRPLKQKIQITEPRKGTKPIRPDEVTVQKQIPAVVIDVFDRLITENYCNGIAKVVQNDVVKALVSEGLDRGEIFDRGWLDVESLYEAEGWLVEYDKPGFNETYEACFIFELKRTVDFYCAIVIEP